MIGILKNAVRNFIDDDGTFLASGLAFGLLFYCVPFALLTVSALSYSLVSSDTALLWVRRYSLTLVPRSKDVFDNIVSAIVAKRGLFGAFGFAAFILAASTTFGSVRLVLNRIFRVREPHGVIRGKFTEVVMMLFTSLLFFLMITVVYLLSVAQTFVSNVKYLAFLDPGLVAIGYLLSVASTFGLFWFLYRFSPAETLSRRGLLVSSGVATGLFEISKWAFGMYVRYSQGTKMVYGALSALVFFLLWLYYVSVIFVFAAEFGCVVDGRTPSRSN